MASCCYITGCGVDGGCSCYLWWSRVLTGSSFFLLSSFVSEWSSGKVWAVTEYQIYTHLFLKIYFIAYCALVSSNSLFHLCPSFCFDRWDCDAHARKPQNTCGKHLSWRMRRHKARSDLVGLSCGELFWSSAWQHTCPTQWPLLPSVTWAH